jgi:1-acyl-sn-glycerol-3-phosphate acyltransferase
MEPLTGASLMTESRRAVVARRLVTIPRSIALFLFLVALAPLLIPLALVIDGIRWLIDRHPAMTIRLLAFAFVFSAVELLGLIWLLGSWIRSRRGNGERLIADAWPIQVWWAQSLLSAVKRIFALDFAVTGQENAAPGPIIALFRHASIVDNLLPAVLITADLGVRLRWVVKRELLTLPSLDVAGRRLPNYFVDRSADDPRRELRQIRALGQDLGPQDGVLIYPEGTRFTTARLRRALERLRAGDDRMLPAAEKLRHVMPPRPGGTLTLLDSGADVVVGMHHGLEGFAKLKDLWAGGLVGRTVNVTLIRIPAADIPAGRRERVDWLYEIWQDIDDWIDLRTGR